SVATQALLVNGERATSPALQLAVDWLLRQRGSDGLWRSYWWSSAAYTTYFALRVLRMCGTANPELLATVAALEARQRADGSWGDDRDGDAFETALATLAVLIAPSRASAGVVTRAIAWLLEHQLPDGSWDSSPILRIPPPMFESPEDVPEWRVDEKRTGVVLSA